MIRKMKWMVSGLVLAFLASCSSDFLPFSGGPLEGAVLAAPATWDAVADVDIIQFETQAGEPYSVNLWVVAMDNQLYVHAGANRADWVEHIEQNPAVRLGVDGSIFELVATRVDDEDEFVRLSEIYKVKYGNYPRNMNLGEIYLYRLARP